MDELEKKRKELMDMVDQLDDQQFDEVYAFITRSSKLSKVKIHYLMSVTDPRNKEETYKTLDEIEKMSDQEVQVLFDKLEKK